MFTVEGTVYNVGQGPAPSSPSWVDRVYLSTQQTGTPTGPQIAEAPHTGGLAASDKYAGTLPATVPASTPAGTYWLVGWTDATQLLAEVDDSNNLGASQSQVILLARPDLEIVPPTWPSGNIARNPSDGTWSIPLLGAKVRNIGPTAASASVSWVDRAYISSVNTGTPDGPVIGTVPHSGGLAASGEYPIGGTGIVPSDVPPGLYWIVIKTDDLDQLVEENEGNNRVVSPTRVNLLP
jgi:hypothetical protein